MDKYQEFVLKQIKYYFVKDLDLKPTDTYSVSEDGVINLKQDENYNIVKYNILFEPKFVSAIKIGGKTYKDLVEIPEFRPLIAVPVDFSKKQEELVILLKNNALDGVPVKLNYIDADRKAFDDKEADRIRRETAQKAEIRLSTGADLVNIYFKPVSDDYKTAKIELYTAIGNYEKHSNAPRPNGFGVAPRYDGPIVITKKLISATVDQLIGKFNVDEGMFFKAITGLARGAYGIKLYEYDSKGKVLVESDILFFDIQ